MGERAKKKRAAESKANRKAKNASEQAQPEHPPLEEDLTSIEPTTSDVRLPKSDAENSKGGTGAASHVTSISSARRSTRLLSSSSKLVSGEKHTLVKAYTDQIIAADPPRLGTGARPQRLATAAAKSLLQQLQICETENSDVEEDPDGESNDAINMIKY
jgi:hypothetical protein